MGGLDSWITGLVYYCLYLLEWAHKCDTILHLRSNYPARLEDVLWLCIGLRCGAPARFLYHCQVAAALRSVGTWKVSSFLRRVGKRRRHTP